ncbi:MAG: DUF1588 domain-containing protein [Planctomycetota bacterium]|nr:DUF1588 domain-containing protein [Planctomycetota bacterium]
MDRNIRLLYPRMELKLPMMPCCGGYESVVERFVREYWGRLRVISGLAVLTFLETAFVAGALADGMLQGTINQYCVDCHGPETRESGVRLDTLEGLSKPEQVDLLNRVEEQVYLRNMPPSDEPSLSPEVRDAFENLITARFEYLNRPSSFRAKLESPGYGNYLDHDRLFSGEVTEMAFSPARLWRTSPHVFDLLKTDLGPTGKDLRQPFIVDDKQGIREYASLLFADAAVVDVLLNNAGTVADGLLEKDPVWRELSGSQVELSEDRFNQAITRHFQHVVYRSPSDDEMSRYWKLFQDSLEDGGKTEALRVTLMAVMLHHESVYRVEIGLGPEDSFGRRRMSPTELAFAIAFALTDRRPDAELLEAARAGGLKNQQDVRTQVTRILDDPAIEKPRILRFFQEFFGYTQAHKVFKDAKRSGGFAYYGENYPVMYERDADFFVLNILERDQDVFKQLLTSDEYFILNRQTFRNTVYDFYRQNQELIDADQFPAEKDRELLDRLGLRSWDELNDKYYLHKFNRGFRGTPKAIRQIVKEARNWKNTTDEEKLRHRMQPLYKKYPMVYDLEDDEQDFLLPQPYARPNRSGILTHPAWLIAHSLNDSTDPIRRGKWIQEHLLAGTVPELPITVDATVPEDHSKTLRERLAITEQEYCWRCHQKMNPLGYSFEVYDDFGRYRQEETLDKLPKVDGEFVSRKVDARASLHGAGHPELDGPVEDALDLIERLARSDRVRQSMIRHVFRFFMGRNERLSDSRTLIAVDRAYVESGGSFNALLVALLTSDSFLYRR